MRKPASSNDRLTGEQIRADYIHRGLITPGWVLTESVPCRSEFHDDSTGTHFDRLSARTGDNVCGSCQYSYKRRSGENSPPVIPKMRGQTGHLPFATAAVLATVMAMAGPNVLEGLDMPSPEKPE